MADLSFILHSAWIIYPLSTRLVTCEVSRNLYLLLIDLPTFVKQRFHEDYILSP